jgi:hypothetical protein
MKKLFAVIGCGCRVSEARFGHSVAERKNVPKVTRHRRPGCASVTRNRERRSNPMRQFKSVVSTIAITSFLVGIAVTPSTAARQNERVRSIGFDGLWSVAIVTHDGPCDSSYRYPARIVGGRVVQADRDFSYQMYGAVSSSGTIVVTVSKGGQSATGYGRLSRLRGGGWWRTAGGQCSGTWTTFRRG